MVVANALYRHDALDEIRQRLREANDFEWDEDLEPDPEGAFQVAWLETGSRAEASPAGLGRRVLATLALTPTTLQVETVSQRRRRACRRRLERLLGDRIHLATLETKPMEEAVRELPSELEPEPMELPPELVAELEERMIRQWLDESIPALGGLTPREAAQTPKGRRQVLALIDHVTRTQEGMRQVPGIFSPDYRKAKKMLGLE